MNVYRYKRGQIWWLIEDKIFDGSVTGGNRPVIIVSNDANNRFSNNLTVIPCTSQEKKDLPTHLKFEINGPSTALCENIRTVSKDNIGQYIGTCDNELIEALDRCVKIALGLENIINDIKQEKDENNEIADEEELTKRGRKTTFTPKYKKKFLDDYYSNGADYMLANYDIKDKKALTNKVYIFKKYMKECC